MICYHHNDMDGKTAGYLVHKMKPKAIEDSPESYVMSTYEDSFDKHTNKDDVFIVDISFTEDTYSKLLDIIKTARTVTWIDHHASSADVVAAHKHELQRMDNLTYFVSKCACGAALVYSYFHINMEEFKRIRMTDKDEEYDIDAVYDPTFGIKLVTSKYNVKNPTNTMWYEYAVPLPRWLFHVDDYDCWKKIDSDTNFFILGCDAVDTRLSKYVTPINASSGYVWNQFWDELSTDPKKVDEYIKNGKIISNYNTNRFAMESGSMFNWEFQGHKFICKNGHGNSFNFGNKIEETEAVILFHYSGKYGKWKYSVYSDEKSTFDCAKFCEQYGGGGHMHSGGFSTKYLIFTHPDQRPLKEDVIFLGGTCADSTWRQEFLARWKKIDTKTKCFNPVVDDWNEEAQKKEEETKNNARVNLFVITPEMIGPFSCVEAVECAHKDENVFFAVYDKHNAFDSRILNSIKATGKLVEEHGSKFAIYNKEDSIDDLVHDVYEFSCKFTDIKTKN